MDVQQEIDRLTALRDAYPRGVRSYEKFRISSQLRKLRLIRAKRNGSHSREEKYRLMREAGDICPVCGVEMLPWRTRRFKTLDHIIPLAKGGDDSVANLRVICNRCNSSKNARLAA